MNINQMRGTPPPKSSEDAWKEHYRLQEEYIDELEKQNNQLKEECAQLAAKNALLEDEMEYASFKIQQLTVAGSELAGWCQVLYDRTNHVDTARELKEAIRNWDKLV